MTPLIAAPWDERLAPSIHEAGHAVIAHRLGVTVDSVCISEDGSGKVDAPDANPRVVVQIALAGGIAEQRYCELVGGCPNAERDPRHSMYSDKERAWKAAQMACGEKTRRASLLLKESLGAVEKQVAEQWDRIAALALAVCQSSNGCVSGQALNNLLKGPLDVQHRDP